ncbi:MAG: hypothetical protein PHP57_12190 [Sideroxydans sp.]|nr:hypothetical protein [Sideroxydans sp.]
MEMILFALQDPFVKGLSVGLCVALLLFVFGLIERRQLKGHILSHMKIYGEGEKRLLSDLDELKEQVFKLKNRVMEYKVKPGRTEMRELYLLYKSISLLNQRVPGFAPAWELVRVEIEKQMEDADSGLISQSMKIVLPHSSWVKRMDSRLGEPAQQEKRDLKS